jgi:hypothetical protein
VSILPFEKIFNIDSPQRRRERGEEVFLICGETTANQKGSSLRETGMLHATRFSREGGFDPTCLRRSGFAQAGRRLPIGSKAISLCDLRVSAVK